MCGMKRNAARTSKAIGNATTLAFTPSGRKCADLRPYGAVESDGVRHMLQTLKPPYEIFHGKGRRISIVYVF